MCVRKLWRCRIGSIWLVRERTVQGKRKAVLWNKITFKLLCALLHTLSVGRNPTGPSRPLKHSIFPYRQLLPVIHTASRRLWSLHGRRVRKRLDLERRLGGVRHERVSHVSSRTNFYYQKKQWLMLRQLWLHAWTSLTQGSNEEKSLKPSTPSATHFNNC